MSDILVVDDEEVLARSIVSFMERRGFSASYAIDARSAKALADRDRPRLVILDVRLGRDNGLDLLGWFKTVSPDTQIVVMTGHGEIGIAVDAMKRGARDFLTKPAPLATIATIAANLMLHEAARPAEPFGVDRILGRSSAAVDLRAAVRRLAPRCDGVLAPPSMLVTGPRGAGKATVARALSEAARISRGPLTEVDCRRADDQLGAALAQKGGTLLLRHVDALTPEAQTGLALSMATPDGPWVIATTSANLARRKRDSAFRPDLYYRIQVGWIEVPALAERSSDILPIAEAFARQAAHRHGCEWPRLTAEARVRLVEHDWPGNLTELAACMEWAVQRAGNAPIGAEHIQILPAGGSATEGPATAGSEEHALNEPSSSRRGDVARGTTVLGIGRERLRHRVEKHNKARPQG